MLKIKDDVDLKELGFTKDDEDYTNKVGFSERSHVAIETKLSIQWFLSMKHSSIALHSLQRLATLLTAPAT